MKKAITVLAPSFVLTSILAIASGLSAFAAAFPELSLATVQMLTALPSLIGMPIILLSGALCSCFSKKEIVTASISLMIIGGLGPLLFHNAFYQLVIFSVLFGIGFGGISPLTTALIREHFSADQQQTMLGYQSAVIGIGGALFSFLGGKLASDCWWHAYFAYLLLLPVLFLILLQPAGEPQAQGQSAYRNICGGDLPFYLCQSVLFAMLFFAFQNNVALLLEHRALGNTSVSGRILAVQSTVGILSGVLGGRILSKLKKFALPAIFLISGFAMLLTYFGSHISFFYLTAAMLGFVFSLRMPAGYLKATASVDPSQATMAIAMYCGSSSLGQFLSPICVNALSVSLDGRLGLSALALLAAGVASVCFELRKHS